MSGRRIDDHSAWMGKGGKEGPVPMQSKMKQEHSAEGDGHLSKYEDTTEAIKGAQDMGARKSKAHATKPGNRN